jgi:transcriptional regulator with XRE-family HTH domain
MDDAKPLSQLRALAGFNQRDLAAKTGLHHLTINALENNPKRTPHPGTMRRIADALGCDIADIREFARVRRPRRRRAQEERPARPAAVA